MSGLEALSYLDDIAHGRKMDYDPHELKKIIENELLILHDIKMHFAGVVADLYFPCLSIRIYQTLGFKNFDEKKFLNFINEKYDKINDKIKEN